MMERLKRVGRIWLLDLGAMTIGLFSVVNISLMLPSRAWTFDFNHFYVSSRLLLLGQNPYTTGLEAMSREMGFDFSREFPTAHYPPSFLRFLEPLASLPPRAAFAVWVVGEVLSLGLLLWITGLLLKDRLSVRGRMFVYTAAIAAPPVYWQFYYSQTQLLLAAAGLGAYMLHRRGRYISACLVVTAAGMLKLYPIVLLPWFVWRHAGSLRERMGRALVALLFGAIVVFATGPGLWVDFFQRGMPVAAKNEIGRYFHYAAPALVTNLGFAWSRFNPTESAARLWWAAGTIVGLVVIAGAYLICLRHEGDEEMEFCLVCAAMLAGTVVVQGHYFVWLIFPMAAAAARIAANPTGGRIIWFGLVLVAANTLSTVATEFLDRHLFLMVLLNYIPLYGVLALAIFFANELRANRRRQGMGELSAAIAVQGQ
jgi:hypothetical protein